jgi:P2 family phage contractile tail tube protein
MGLPAKLKNWDVYSNGEDYAGVAAEITLPKLAEKVESWRGAGMLAEVDVSMGLEKLELEHKYGGLVLGILRQFGAVGVSASMIRFVGGVIAEEVDKLGADDMLLIAREISTFMDKGETVDRDDDDADADAPRKMHATAMLSVPIAREGGAALDKLELRRPDAGALRNLSLSDVGQLQVRALLTLLPRICTEKLTRKDLLKIDFADWMEIAGEVGDFLLPRRLRTV